MPDGFLTAIAAVANVLFLGGGIYIYFALVRQVNARAPVAPGEAERTFGWPEAILASGLATLFMLNAWVAYARIVGRLKRRVYEKS